MLKEYFEKRKQNKSNLDIYKRKKSDVKKRLAKEFIDHGIATIPCKVEGIEDIISKYSVPGYESLDSEFVDYLNSLVELVPEQYPIVLSIVGGKFTPKEQETIKDTIESDLAYDLGFAEKDSRHLWRMLLFFIVGSVISGISIVLFDWLPLVPVELLYIFFWFFAYTFVEYIFIEGRDIKKQRIKAARRACISVKFSDEYDDSDYSESEARKIFEELGNK